MADEKFRKIGVSVDHQGFLDLAQQPGFPDEFVLQLDGQYLPKGKTLSPDALEQLILTIRSWIGARIIARWDSTGNPPRQLKLHLKLSWELQDEDDIEPPWFTLSDPESKVGIHRPDPTIDRKRMP